MSRCAKYIFDTTTKRTRKCKNKKCLRELCTIHYKMFYNDSIIIIQSIFRGNKVRSKLNNIFFKLPEEIRHIVIENIREDYYNTKRNNIIVNIINNRLIILLGISYNEFYFYEQENLYFLEINKLYILLNKYFCIIKLNKNIKKLYNLTKLRHYTIDNSGSINPTLQFLILYKDINYLV